MTLPPDQYRQMERHVPEPLYVQPESVRLMRDRETSDEHGSHGWLGLVLLAVVLLAVGTLAVHVLAALQDATSRSAQEPFPYVGVGGSPALTGVPQSHAPVSAAAFVPDSHTGGTPYTLDPRVGREGDIAHSGSRTPYVAIPLGPGIRIRVCGPADCISVTSTDAGPNRAMLMAGRIMDLDITRWERVCGVPARYGLCPGSWVRETGPRLTLPPTSTEGGQP